jgi:hypothetical protein
MSRRSKTKVAEELFTHMAMTREQYEQFCILSDELDLEKVESKYVEPDKAERK